MPSILIHIAFGYILYRCVTSFDRFKHLKKYLFLFLSGSLIPDIKYVVAWITYFVMGNGNYAVLSSLFVTHQLFGSLLIALFLSSTLFRNIFKISLAILVFEFSGHFLLDISQYPFTHINHTLLLYPFSDKIFYINFGFINGVLVFEIVQYLILGVALILVIWETFFNNLREI